MKVFLLEAKDWLCSSDVCVFLFIRTAHTFEDLHRDACAQQLDHLHAFFRDYCKKYGFIEMSYSVSFRGVFNLSSFKEGTSR